MATVADHIRPVPSATERAARYRHVGTAALIEEAEIRRWEVTGMLADLERDPDAWDHPAETLDYMLTALEDAEAELNRRVGLRTRPGAPHWPRRNARRDNDLTTLAADVKALWPVERYCADVLGVVLARSGARFVGSCPFPDHPDPEPSFTIYPEPRGWYCFGCGRGGDVFALAGMLHGLDRFRDQLRHLAELTGATGGEVRRAS